jgi:multidrug efflux pump subunit AcrA (membrane-fusion protein)
MHAKADRDAALTFKNLEIAERERARQQELAEQERKLVVAQQQAELEKLELAAKEAETNEAKAKAHLSQLNLEIVQNDAKGLLKHQLQEAQVERGRERFAKKDKDKDVVVAPEAVAAEPDLSSEVAEAEA